MPGPAADMSGGAWEGRAVVVAGAGMAGAAAARALLARGAGVTVVDARESSATADLAGAGARVVIGDAPAAGLFDGVAEIVVSPGFPPHHRLVAAARAAGAEVYSEPELAWRLRPASGAAPWLAVTGTNGKTTAVTMLAAILRAAGHRTVACGNIGVPLVDLPGPGDPDGYDVLAVELSSQQLHWSRRLAPAAGALLNLADDHLDWHGGFDAYAAAKTAIWRAAMIPEDLTAQSMSELTGSWRGVIGNADDPEVVARMPGGGVGLTLGEPEPGQLGVVDGWLVDRATGAGTATGDGSGGDAPAEGVPLVAAARVRPAGDHHVANALAAAALARWYGVPAAAVAAGLAGYRPEPHRGSVVATVAGVAYVDDSKATNPHAALASLSGYPRVVWIAGGQLKGVDVAALVRAVAPRLAGAVLLGVDRARLAEALARHAPRVPVVEVATTDNGAMGEVVRAAHRLALSAGAGPRPEEPVDAGPRPAVLLAPAAASKDMYPGYPERGKAFAAAARAMEDTGGGP